jgi:hypothetical protein
MTNDELITFSCHRPKKQDKIDRRIRLITKYYEPGKMK